MEKTLKLIKEVVFLSIFEFILLSIIYKLICKLDDWLYRSLCWTITYNIVRIIKSYNIELKGIKKVVFNILASLGTAILTLFVSGVCLSLNNYWQHTFYITTAFVVSLLLAKPIEIKADDVNQEKTKNEQIDTKIIV